MYKLFITTSGIGSRLKELTKKTNKVLLQVGGKTAIRWVIDPYPPTVPVVVTLGYYGREVREFLEGAYPDRNFEFVEVDTYEGEGSSQGYSMLKAKGSLDCPFIFHACDTLVTEFVPAPDRNWVAGFRVERAIEQGMPLAQYRTHTVENNRIVKFLDKGEQGFQSIHIGLCGIADHVRFWDLFQNLYDSNPMNSTLSEVPVLEMMLQEGLVFDWVPYDVWLDTGNLEALAKTEAYFKDKK